MNNITLGALENGPHASLIRSMAENCGKDGRIQAIWIGGSLAAGHGDIYSDIDFRIAVEPGQVDDWTNPDWAQYLPILPCGGTFRRFGEQALLHHLVLTDGTIVDFYVQDTERDNFEPKVVILASRDAALREKLERFSRPAASLVSEIEAARVRQFLVDYWITTHKEMKALARQYDLSPFVGLYYERLAVLRAWYMQVTGKDINGHATLHLLGALHRGMAGNLTEAQQILMGLPSRTPEETVTAIEAIRAEMAEVGRWLAEKYAFAYPHEIEDVAQRVWHEQKAAFMKR